jgi:hypothetical protein
MVKSPNHDVLAVTALLDALRAGLHLTGDEDGSRSRPMRSRAVLIDGRLINWRSKVILVSCEEAKG